MAGSLNKAMLIGNVGADPEIRTTQAGERIANLRVATSESWKDKRSGERKERTEWHTVVIFGDGTAGFVDQYVSKGDKVFIEGQIQTRKWQDKDGNDRYATEIVVSGFGGKIELLTSKGGSRSGDDEDEDRGSRRSRSREDSEDRGSGRRSRSRDEDDTPSRRGSSRNESSRNRHDDLDDDIPFARQVPAEFASGEGAPLTGCGLRVGRDF